MKNVCIFLCLFSTSVYCQNDVAVSETSSRKSKTILSESADAIDPAAIDIVRDKFGVPHIFARTDREVAYGLAWAHSEDDFETIQKSFLASRAMHGQHLGKHGAIVDYVVHLLRLRELVNKRYAQDISPDFKEVLQGYCDGYNAYAESHPKEVLEKKAFPAIPQDILAYSVLQLALGTGVDDALKNIHNETTPLAQWEPSGSNAIAFNSAKTEDGAVYLTINTHHPLEGQVSWYEAHLSSAQGWNIVGALFPGAPVIFTGFNENLGWTHTVNHPDRLDVYQLEMNPDNALQYKVDNEWYTLEESVVKLKVKVPGVNVQARKKAYWSIYGPTLITDRGTFSIRTPALMDIRGLEQWYRMNKSETFADFRKALKMEAHPSYNIVYGDRYDTIYYLSNARLPVRQSRFNWKGTLPGNTSETMWTKFHPVEQLPQVLNPPTGFVYNTNHSPFKATIHGNPMPGYDSTMGYETHDNNRSHRMMELVPAKDKITYQDFKRIKYDLQLPDRLAFPVNIDSLFMISANDHPEVADIIETLRDWDRKANIESNGAAVFAVLFYYIADKYQKDRTFTVMTKRDCIDALHYAKEYLLKHFGSTNIMLGEYQRLERGKKSLPLAGLPDVLAQMYSTPAGNGRVKGTIGECYIAFAQYKPEGLPEIETINCYGASNRPGSPHYDDQMELFVQQKTKKMTLDKELVYREAESIYHPEELSRVRVDARELARKREAWKR